VLNILFRLLLTFNATSLLLIVFVVQKGYRLRELVPFKLDWLGLLPLPIEYICYLAVPLSLTRLSIVLSRYLGSDKFRSGDIVNIEHANNSFLPSYLGYFFVALSISSAQALAFVYLTLFVFTFRSQALYFNPLFLIYGYEFYNVRTASGICLFLISKREFKDPTTVEIELACRINDYTFIERN